MTAKPVPEHISDERLAEMLAAAEKATPGPRERHVIDASTYRYVEDAEKAVARDQADADFNALCDPQTITALLTELQHRREAEAEPAFWHNGQRQMITNAVKVGKPVDEDDARWISRFDQPLYAASPSSPASWVRVKATHRHVKRGSEYELLGYGKMQAESWEEYVTNNGRPHHAKVDMREVAIYRSVDDGALWARPREEFEDGRFVALSALGEHP